MKIDNIFIKNSYLNIEYCTNNTYDCIENICTKSLNCNGKYKSLSDCKLQCPSKPISNFKLKWMYNIGNVESSVSPTTSNNDNSVYISDKGFLSFM